jgi:nucleoid-associated protein YgaU
MPTLLERLFGKKTETKVEPPVAKVSEEAAKARREQLEKDRLAAEEAVKKAAEAEKQRLVAVEAQKKAAAEAAAALDKMTSQEAIEAKEKAAAAASKREYVAASGDSLSRIAKELLGDAKRWPEIYEANKALIGDNPNLIHPGQKLIIP